VAGVTFSSDLDNPLYAWDNGGFVGGSALPESVSIGGTDWVHR